MRSLSEAVVAGGLTVLVLIVGASYTSATPVVGVTALRGCQTQCSRPLIQIRRRPALASHRIVGTATPD